MLLMDRNVFSTKGKVLQLTMFLLQRLFNVLIENSRSLVTNSKVHVPCALVIT